ncbi:hypothetical protein MXB_5253 [Myxobolus squamalis]|nr:hypothetical protein MXB_5253 [Myxobolus squamalis]
MRKILLSLPGLTALLVYMFPEHFEKYINCLAVDDCGCIVCGGGPQLSMWHMSTKTKIFTFEISPNTKPCTINIHNHKCYFLAGRLPEIHVYTHNLQHVDTIYLTPHSDT